MSAASAASGSPPPTSSAKRSSARTRASLARPPRRCSIARRRASSESGSTPHEAHASAVFAASRRARRCGLDLLDRRDAVARAPALEPRLEAQRRGELGVGRRGGGVGRDARGRAVVARPRDRDRRGTTATTGSGGVAVGELAQARRARPSVSPAACARMRRDEREAARELRIGLEGRELLDRATRAIAPVGVDVRRRAARTPRARGRARPRAGSRAISRSVLAAPSASPRACREPNELDVERHRLGLGAARREQALGRLLVPGRVARDAGERAREPAGRRRRRAEHRGLAERGLRPRRVARPHGPHVGRQEERAPARLVGPEVLGERLELRRERARVGAVGQHVELQRPRRQAPGVARDGPRRAPRARAAVSPSAAACSATRMASAAPRPGSVVRGQPLRRRSGRRGPCRPSARRRGSARRPRPAARARPRRPASRRRGARAARSSVARRRATSCPRCRRASAARSHASTMRAGWRTHARNARARRRAPRRRWPPAPARRVASSACGVELGPRAHLVVSRRCPGGRASSVSRSTVAVHVACDSSERASSTSATAASISPRGRAHAGAIEEQQRAPGRVGRVAPRARRAPLRAPPGRRSGRRGPRARARRSPARRRGAPIDRGRFAGADLRLGGIRRDVGDGRRRASAAPGPSRRARVAARHQRVDQASRGCAGCAASRAGGRGPRAARGRSESAL